MIGFRPIGGTSSPFVLVILALINATPGRCPHTPDNEYRPHGQVFLVAFRDSENGVEVTAFPAKESDDVQGKCPTNEAQTIVPGYKLSCDCGDLFFRCRDVLVTISEQDGKQIIFIPLENGVLFVSYWFDSNKATVEWDTSVINVPDYNPTLFYSAGSKIYTVCINLTRQVIAVYEIPKSQENATPIGPLTEVTVPELSSSDLSSYVVDVSDSGNKVYFAVNSTIYVMNVLEPKLTMSSPQLPGCIQINKLIPATGDNGKQLLLAHCTDKYAYFNPTYDNWDSVSYSRSGIPYLCPNKDYKVFLFYDTMRVRYLNFTVVGLYSKVIYGVDISRLNGTDSVCFEVENRTYFTYSNQNHSVVDVFVFNFSSQSLYSVMSYECSITACPQMLLLDDHYLAVHVAGNVYVLDAKNKFSLIMNATTGTPDTSIVTIIQMNIHNETCPTAATVTPFRNGTTMVPPNTTSKTRIAVIVCGMFIIVVILIATIVVVSIKFVKKHRYNMTRVRNNLRLRFATHQTLALTDELVTRPSGDVDDTEGEDNYDMKSPLTDLL